MADRQVGVYPSLVAGSSQARLLRLSFAGLGLGLLALVVGLGLRQSWATRLWQWDDERMSFIFLASIAAAVAAPALWVAISGEFAAWAGVAINGIVVGSLATAYLLTRVLRDLEPSAWPAMLVFGSLVPVAVAVFRLTHRYPVRDTRPLPGFVRIWFVVFAVILIGAGTALLLQVERVFPWNLAPAASTLFGCFFLGAASYFIYSLRVDRWVTAAGALWSFLAYDIVLAIPYLDLLRNRDDGGGSTFGGLYGSTTSGSAADVNELSLAIYLTVIGVSSLVAVYALLVHPASRVWRRS